MGIGGGDAVGRRCDPSGARNGGSGEEGTGWKELEHQKRSLVLSY